MKAEAEKAPEGKGGNNNPTTEGKWTGANPIAQQTVVRQQKLIGRCDGLKGDIFDRAD